MDLSICQMLANYLFCSYLLPIGLSLESDTLMGIIYLLLLFYMFMGIAIVSDIFMETIETITA